MLTGMLAVRNAMCGERNDLWSVNTEPEYHEEVHLEERPETAAARDALSQAFARLDGVAFGLASGLAAGLVLFLATITLVIKGGPVVGPNLQLLSQYFPGYTITAAGSLVGLAYGFVVAFVAAWVFACVRNATVFLYLVVIHRRAELARLWRILEYL